MGHHHHDQTLPRGALIGAGVLLAASIALAAGARSTMTSVEANVQVSPVIDSIELRFEDRPNGSVAILEHASGLQRGEVAPAEGGFVRGVMRGMFRTRKLESIATDLPFRLLRREDGTLMLEDPFSGRTVTLQGFGDTNYHAFAHLLDERNS